MIDYRNVIQAYYRMKTFKSKSIHEMEAFQFKRFKELISHAYAHVPMYRELYESNGFCPSSIKEFSDIEQVPILTKGYVRSFPLQSRVIPQSLNAKVHRETTSGSTGEPTEIWTSPTDSLIQTLKGVRMLREWGYSPFDMTVQLWRQDVEPKASVLQRLGMFRRKLVSIMDEPDEKVRKIQESDCDVLIATRSSLEILAEELNARNIKIRPKFILSASEVLTDEHRKLFRQTFACETLNQYGCMEIGNIAWGCPSHPDQLHVDMETMMVNYRDERKAPNGKKVASIAVTNLENWVMPFIRFDTGDEIQLPENSYCDCGRALPLLGEVSGRSDDIIEYGGQKYNFHFFYNYFKNFLYIRKYRVVQTRAKDIVFRIQLRADGEAERKQCRSDLEQVFGTHFSPLKVEFVQTFPAAKSGKMKSIEVER